MSNKNHEVERLKRIRDNQLRARDPQTKQKQLQHNFSNRYRSSRETFSFKGFWLGVAQKWRGIIIGGFLGTIVMVAIPNFFDDDRAALLGLVVFVFLPVMGFMIGQAADARDEIEDLIKKR